MEDLTLPFTISPLSTQVLLVWKSMEAKCLLGLKKTTKQKSDRCPELSIEENLLSPNKHQRY